jgi:hypothetical protein
MISQLKDPKAAKLKLKNKCKNTILITLSDDSFIKNDDFKRYK